MGSNKTMASPSGGGPNAMLPDEMLDDVEPAPEATDAQLKRVSTLAQAQLALVVEIEKLNDQLAQKMAALKTNMESDLPAAMSEAGQEKCKIAGGATVEVKKLVVASIPKALRQEGLAYMEKAAPDLVKHTVSIEFGRGDAKFFEKFIRDLGKRKKPVNATIEDTIAPQTLGKFVRDRDKEGVGVPEDILGVFRKRIATVTLPKLKATEV